MTCLLHSYSISFQVKHYHLPHNPTVAGPEVIPDVGVEVATQAAGAAHVFGAHLDVDWGSVTIPREREAVLLGHQDILCYLLHLHIVDIVGQLKTGHTYIILGLHCWALDIQRCLQRTALLHTGHSADWCLPARLNHVWTDHIHFH